MGELSRGVRESTMKRLRRVETGDRFWSPRPDLLTFADMLQHLIDADRWLLGRLAGESLPPARIAPHDADGIEWEVALSELERLGEERARRLTEFTAADLMERTVEISATDGNAPLWSLVLRRGIDHEIHHRGGLQIMLHLRYGG